MMLDRRNHVRRKVCGGTVAGALAGLLAALAEAALLGGGGAASAGAAGAAGVAGAMAWAPALVGLGVAAGAAVGAALGLVVAAAEPIIEVFAQRRRSRPRAAAMVYALCAAPFAAAAASHLVPESLGVAAHAAAAVGAGAALVLASFGVLWAIVGAAARIDHLAKRGAGQVRWAVLGAVVAAAAGVGLLALARAAADSASLRALAELCGLSFMVLAIAGLSLAARAGERRWARVAAPRGALAVALVAVTVGALALTALTRPERAPARAMLRREIALVHALDRE
jgi:hypothetical protein